MFDGLGVFFRNRFQVVMIVFHLIHNGNLPLPKPSKLWSMLLNFI
jgi:hypothetical protein